MLKHVISANDDAVKYKSRRMRVFDYARSGLREALIAKIEEPELSESDLRRIVHRNILQAIVAGDVIESNPHDDVDAALELMMHRLFLFDFAPLIGFKRHSSENIMIIDRLQPLLLDGARQYGSPDLIVKNGSRLCLVRLSMEIPRRIPNEATELELGSMLLWAERNPLIVNELEDIDVVRIGWLGTRWIKWRKKASRNWSNQSRSMISMDIEQMARLMIFDGDFKDLPSAKSSWRCLNCPFKADCDES